MARGEAFEVVGFDADDTLWRSEETFREAEEMFIELVAPHAPDGIDVTDALHAIERDNISVSGYGVKAFTLFHFSPRYTEQAHLFRQEARKAYAQANRSRG